MKFHIKYFEKTLGDLPVEDLWVLIDELIAPYPNSFDKKKMNYDDVLELAVILKASDEIFRNLEQVAILKHDLDEAHL